MKTILSVLKRVMVGVIAYFVAIAVFITVFYLSDIPLNLFFYPWLLATFFLLIAFLRECIKTKEKTTALKKLSYMTPAEIVEKLPRDACGFEKEYQNIIESLFKQLSLKIEEYDTKNHELSNYYATWVHQAKTPIASMRLQLQGKDSSEARDLLRYLRDIEGYVDMVMSYIRLNSEHTDYVIKKEDLSEIVKESVKKFKLDFIAKKLSLTINMDKAIVYTDKKWISLVIEQILSNSLKYTKTGGVTIGYDDKTSTLSIKDTGMGIDKENLPRIFEQGFTGFNGRREAHSSGIGLYIVKSVCDSLNVSIRCESTPAVGTEMFLTFASKEEVVE